MDISAPVAQPTIPCTPPAVALPPGRSPSRDRGSFRNVDISGPVLQSTSNSHAATHRPTRPVPLRPAPAVPTPAVPTPGNVQRAPSCPTRGSVRGRVMRSASQRSTGPRPAQPPPPRPLLPDGSGGGVLYDDCTNTMQFVPQTVALNGPHYSSLQRPEPNSHRGVAALAQRFEQAAEPVHCRAPPNQRLYSVPNS